MTGPRPTSGGTIQAVSLPLITGLLIRGLPVVTADFPLNDGGLFYAMTRDLQNSGFLIPATTSYNGLDIPFAYPPLAFYLAGTVASATGVALIDVFRFLPLILATLAIPVVYLIAREVLATRFQAIIATWVFAFLPRAFDWLVIGGGMTRSLGILFAMLAILEGIRFYRTGQRRHGAALAVFAGLTALSHPQAAVFVGLSMVLILLTYRRTWRTLRDSVVLGVVAAIVAAPWWLTVIATHGTGPFLSGGQTGADPTSSFHFLVTFTFTDEPYATVLAVVGVIGTVYLATARRYLLPAWILVVFVVDPRAAATELMLPLAMIVAVAVDEVFLARIGRGEPDPGRLWPREVVRDRFGRALLAVGLVLGVIGGVRASTGIGSPLQALSPANRADMAWIAAEAPASTEFVVISGGSWFIDPNSEWFPVLTGHRSVATVQGYEWLGKQAFDDQLDRSYQIQICTWIGPDCVDDWVARYDAAQAWLYVPISSIGTFTPTGDCCAALRTALAGSARYVMVYEGPGGAVFSPRPGS